MRPTIVVLITGYPASGKTTFARYLAKEIGLPLLCKDDMKEVLFDTLGWEPEEWSRKLGGAAWSLFYHQVERLLEAQVDHIAEANFDPKYDDPKWQRLTTQFDVQIIQVRCECDADVLMARDRQRIAQGTRHPGHIRADDPAFYEAVKRGSIGWLDVEGERISLNTTEGAVEGYAVVVKKILEIATFR